MRKQREQSKGLGNWRGDGGGDVRLYGYLGRSVLQTKKFARLISPIIAVDFSSLQYKYV